MFFVNFHDQYLNLLKPLYIYILIVIPLFCCSLLIFPRSSVQPVSFCVPRKEKKKFHEDLFSVSYWEAGRKDIL